MKRQYQKFAANLDTLTSVLGFYCFMALIPFFFRESAPVVAVLSAAAALWAICAALRLTGQLRVKSNRGTMDMSAAHFLKLLGRLGFVRFRFHTVLLLLVSGAQLAGWKLWLVFPPLLPFVSGVLLLVLTGVSMSFRLQQLRPRLRARMAQQAERPLLDGLFPQSALATAGN